MTNPELTRLREQTAREDTDEFRRLAEQGNQTAAEQLAEVEDE
jgi:hypothetical protein